MVEMVETIQTITASNVLITVVVTYLIVEALKKTKKVHLDFIPLVSMVTGILIGIVVGYFTDGVDHLFTAAITGLLSGGFASGLYDTVKKSILNKNKGEG